MQTENSYLDLMLPELERKSLLTITLVLLWRKIFLPLKS